MKRGKDPPARTTGLLSSRCSPRIVVQADNLSGAPQDPPQASSPAFPLPEPVRDHSISVQPKQISSPNHQPNAANSNDNNNNKSYSKPRERSKYDDITVDGTIIDIDHYIETNNIQTSRGKDYKENMIVNEVNADSVIGGAPKLEAWRNSARENKGISVIELDDCIKKNVNVDSVIRLEQERPQLLMPASNHAYMSTVSEGDVEKDECDDNYDGQKEVPKRFIPRPPSKLDQEINVDSVIRINNEQKFQQQRRDERKNENNKYPRVNNKPEEEIMNKVNVDSVIRLQSENNESKQQKFRKQNFFSKLFGKKNRK